MFVTARIVCMSWIPAAMWMQKKKRKNKRRKEKLAITWFTVSRSIITSREPQLLCSFSGQSTLCGIRNPGRGLLWRRLTNRTSSSETRSSRPSWNGISWLSQRTPLSSACTAPLKQGATYAWSWNTWKVSQCLTQRTWHLYPEITGSFVRWRPSLLGCGMVVAAQELKPGNEMAVFPVIIFW